MLQFRDVYPRLRILIFLHPGSRISDPGSRIPDLGSRISDPGSRIPDLGSRIPDPGSRIQQQQLKRRGKNKFVVLPIFVVKNITKLKKYFIFELEKKNVSHFRKDYRQMWVWDPGSENRDPEKYYSGSRIEGSKRHRIPNQDPQHCPVGANVPLFSCISSCLHVFTILF